MLNTKDLHEFTAEAEGPIIDEVSRRTGNRGCFDHEFSLDKLFVLLYDKSFNRIQPFKAVLARGGV